MMALTSWESLPPELWFTILEKLPLKSQVSLACTCKKLYTRSLDSFLGNLQQRVWLYVEAHTPLPDLLAKAITILRIPPPPYDDEQPESRSGFLKEQINRMSSLRALILENNANIYGYLLNDEKEYLLSVSDLQEIVSQNNLEVLKTPPPFLTKRSAIGKTFLHLAVEKGNTKLVDCLLSQMEVYFQQEGKKKATTFSEEINESDADGYTPLKIAIRQGTEELILLLLKKGARGKCYFLSKKSKGLSHIIKDKVDKGSHLHVKCLNPMLFEAFFEAVAESSHILSLSFATKCYRELKTERPDFFQNLAGALRRNYSKHSSTLPATVENPQKSPGILLLDLREFKELTASDIKPLFTCPGLKELLLPTSLIDYLDACNQNLLHLLVQESSEGQSKGIAESFIAQGVALSSRDHQGDTPIQLAKKLGLQAGNQAMAAFLEQAAKRKMTAIAFGKKDWEKYFGKVGKEPLLPSYVLEILESPCPIWHGKKVQDTHLLTLIPEKVNGKPFTLDYLDALVENPKEGGNKTRYRIYRGSVRIELGSKPSGSSYWVLMTKDVLPSTLYKPYDEQLAELNILTARAPQADGLGAYQAPKILEAATSILMEYVRRGVRLYSDPEGSSEDWTYTYCEETVDRGSDRVIIGCFVAGGINVHASNAYRLGAMRKCLGS